MRHKRQGNGFQKTNLLPKVGKRFLPSLALQQLNSSAFTLQKSAPLPCCHCARRKMNVLCWRGLTHPVDSSSFIDILVLGGPQLHTHYLWWTCQSSPHAQGIFIRANELADTETIWKFVFRGTEFAPCVVQRWRHCTGSTVIECTFGEILLWRWISA